MVLTRTSKGQAIVQTQRAGNLFGDVKMIRLPILIVQLFILTSMAHAGEFRAAARKVDITPTGSEPLWGFGDRTGPATGMLDPLFAKIVVFEGDSSRLALVTFDLGRTFNTAGMETVRQRVADSSDVADVIFCASHTHSGPVISDSYGDNGRPDWETNAINRISEAIEDACARLVSARIGVGYGETFIGHNRRKIEPDGSVTMLWRNAAKSPTSPVDPRVGVIRVDDEDDNTIAVLVNYACHPVVLGPDNLEYSADFPGAMASVVESELGGNTICLFLQGAAGDINPFYDKMALAEDGVKLMQETGTQLGNEVVRVAKSVNTEVPAHPHLRHKRDTITFQSRWNVEKVLGMLKQRMKPDVYDRYRDYLTSPLDCDVTSLIINDDIAMMGMPGEPFTEFATAYRARSPVRHSFFLGYTNGYHGYFPTIRAAVSGGYGADTIVARAEVGAGERMLDRAIIQHHELLRQLEPVPSD